MTSYLIAIMADFRTVFLIALTVTIAAAVCKQNRNCLRPKCSCATTDTPNNMKRDDIPQFVMLSFDDAVNIVNFNNTYQHLFLGNYKNKANGCNIAATFFVTHEYADYQLCHELHRYGSEMAVHSITHEPSTEMWKNADFRRWKNEMSGMKKILSTFANIDEKKITGHRAPFLQTAGDTTFEMLNRQEFHYDSSMPTLTKTGNPKCTGKSDGPIWPYTLDHGYEQDCQIQPCPANEYRGLWEVPLVSYTSVKNTNFKCSMADACTPYPEKEEDTFEYFKWNFERHYNCNRAPFPVFLHEAWLRHSERHKGYFKFVQWLLEKNDVYLVTVQTVLEYIKNPVKIKDYKQPNCVNDTTLPNSNCPRHACKFENLEQFYGSTRYMMSCVTCPTKYPWYENPEGN